MRLLLDTNVWSRLIDRGAGEDFYRYAKADKIEVVIAPATLLELLERRTGLIGESGSAWFADRGGLGFRPRPSRRPLNSSLRSVGCVPAGSARNLTISN